MLTINLNGDANFNAEALVYDLWDHANRECSTGTESLAQVVAWLNSGHFSKLGLGLVGVPAEMVLEAVQLATELAFTEAEQEAAYAVQLAAELEEQAARDVVQVEEEEEEQVEELTGAQILEQAAEILVSVDRKDVEEATNIANRARFGKLIRTLGKAVESKAVLGSYKEEGQAEASTESSAWIKANTQVIELLATEACTKYKQDCVLILLADASAYLWHPEWSMHLGTMQKISELEAKMSECYTFDGVDYWYAK